MTKDEALNALKKAIEHKKEGKSLEDWEKGCIFAAERKQIPPAEMKE